MLALETIRAHQRFPTVLCPTCRQSMFLRDLRPLMFTALYRGTYHCVECDQEVLREFKDGRGEQQRSAA